MKAHLEANPQGKHGRNSYTLEEFGLDEPTVNLKFAKYKAKYNV